MDVSAKPLQVVIIGGSLSGLMCGIAMKQAGHFVTILERATNERQSHMAGVCLGLDATQYLARHDRHSTNFSHRTTRVQALDRNGEITTFVKNGQRDITSWDTYYFRLRSLFDGYGSSYYPSPPEGFEAEAAGLQPVSYSYQKQVVDIQSSNSSSPMLLTVQDEQSQTTSHVEADLVIGADGADSFIRTRYLPDIKKQYVGYVAWRGTVPESEVCAETIAIFSQSVTVHMMHKNHVIMYMIPGPRGSLEPGKRLLNFLWYTNETKESLAEIVIDGLDGHAHHNTVPAGHIRKNIWDAMLRRARATPLPGPFLEVIEKIEKPFLQVIKEFCSSRVSFENGRVLLVGDAVALLRPHTAFSGTQAAFHITKLEELLTKRISLDEYQENILRYSRLHLAQSVWWGNFYQSNMGYAVGTALYYWLLCGHDLVKSWWSGKPTLLRTTTFFAQEQQPA